MSGRSKLLWASLPCALVAGCAHFQSQPIEPTETAASLQARTLSDPKLREFLELNSQRRFERWPPPVWDFEALNLVALYYHPSLDVARAQWQVALGGTRTAAARPNPTLNVIPGYDLNPSEGLSPWIPAVVFDLPIETGHKRKYRRAQAHSLSESTRLSIAAAAWQIRSNLRVTLVDFIAAGEREQLLNRQKATQQRIIQLLEQQLQAGAISRSELTLVRIALDQIQLDLSDAQQQLADARVRLADALGVSASALEPMRVAYDLSARPDVAALLSADVHRQALASRADILSALAEYAARQSALQLELAKQYPDIHLGPGYQYDQGDHKLTLSLTAELPLLHQNQGPIAEAEARRTEAAARFLALQAKVLTQMDRAVAAWQVAQTNISTMESLLSSHQDRAAAVDTQFRAGAADQLELLNSQIELGVSRLLRLNGWTKLQQSFAALEDAVQRPIDSMAPRLFEQPPRLRPEP